MAVTIMSILGLHLQIKHSYNVVTKLTKAFLFVERHVVLEIGFL